MSEDRLINYLESYRKQWEVEAGGHRREESLAMRDTVEHQQTTRNLLGGILFMVTVQTALLVFAFLGM